MNATRHLSSVFFTSTLAISASTSLAQSDYASVVLDDDPIAYYRLDDEGPDVTDASGNDNHGVADGEGLEFGAASLLPNEENGALTLLGDRIIVPGFEKVANGFTVEFLMKLDAPPAAFSNLVGDGEEGGDFNLMVYITPEGVVRPHVNTSVGVYARDSAEVLADGMTHHVVSTWDRGSGVHTLYIDGKEAEVTTGPGFNPFQGDPLNSDNPLYIGRDNREEGFNGVLDEVAIYDYALSDDDVVEHFAEAFGLLGQSYDEEVLADEPLAYWRLEDISGPAEDETGSGLDAEIGPEGEILFDQPSLIPPDDGFAIQTIGGSLISPPFEKMNSGFTVEFVTRIDALTPAFTNLVGDGEDAGDFSLMIYLAPNGSIRPHVNTSEGVFAVDSVKSIVDGRLHHIASTWNRETGAHALYIDGELAEVTPVAGAAPVTGDPLNSDNPIYIGRDNRETGHTFWVDEVAVYDKALDAERVAAHTAWIEFPEPPPAEPLQDPGTLSNAPEQMIHYYDFNEARAPSENFSLNFAYDRIADADGSFEGAATRVAGLSGRGAVAFDNSFAAGINVGSIGFEFTEGLTIEAIIVPDWSGDDGDYDTIFRKEDGGNRILFGFQNDAFSESANPPLEPNTPVLSLGLNTGGYQELDMPLDGSNDIGLELDDLLDGEPHHIAATYDSASGEKAIWIDGEKGWSVTLEPGTPLVTGGDTVGFIGNTNGGADPFSGTIDEVAFWSRSLSEDEIQTHADLAAEGDFRPYFPVFDGPSAYEAIVLEDNPTGYWRLGDEGPIAADISGNERDGEEGFFDDFLFWESQPLLVNDRDTSVEFTNNRILVPEFEKIGEDGFSLEFLMLADQAPGGFRNLVGDGEGGLDFMLMVYLTADGAIRPHYQTEDGFYSIDTVATYADGVIHHVVSTWDATTGEAVLYVDGAPAEVTPSAGELPTTGAAINTDNTFYIGGDDREPFFNGFLDEVALYGYPLDADRVAAHALEALGELPSPSTGGITNIRLNGDGTITLEGEGSVSAAATVEGPYSGSTPLPATLTIEGSTQFFRVEN